MTNRINELKEETPIIYRELEKLINSIASLRLDEDSELDIAYNISKFKKELDL